MTGHSSGITKEYIAALKPAAFVRVFGKAVDNAEISRITLKFTPEGGATLTSFKFLPVGLTVEAAKASWPTHKAKVPMKEVTIALAEMPPQDFT